MYVNIIHFSLRENKTIICEKIFSRICMVNRQDKLINLKLANCNNFLYCIVINK